LVYLLGLLYQVTDALSIYLRLSFRA
jgi:hypothetical protein